MLGRGAEGALAAVGLIPVTEMTAGAREIRVALIDGPVAADRADLAIENIRSLSAATGATTSGNGVAAAHGTYVAGILAARRGSSARAICPGCTLLIRPIFLETASENAEMPSATPEKASAETIRPAPFLTPTVLQWEREGPAQRESEGGRAGSGAHAYSGLDLNLVSRGNRR